MQRSVRIVVALAIAVIAVTGCASCATVQPAPIASTTPTPSTAPVLASEQDALVAATKAYTAYLAVSDAILADGGKNPERIEPHVTPAYVADVTNGFERIQELELHGIGVTRFDSMTVQSIEGDTLVVYLCSDVSGTQLVNASGEDKTPESRITRIPLQVGFAAKGMGPEGLLIAGSEVWSGDDFC